MPSGDGHRFAARACRPGRPARPCRAIAASSRDCRGAGTSVGDFSAAARVYWTLKVAGHRRSSILSGGMTAWHGIRHAGSRAARARAGVGAGYPVALAGVLRADLGAVEVGGLGAQRRVARQPHRRFFSRVAQNRHRRPGRPASGGASARPCLGLRQGCPEAEVAGRARAAVCGNPAAAGDQLLQQPVIRRRPTGSFSRAAGPPQASLSTSARCRSGRSGKPARRGRRGRARGRGGRSYAHLGCSRIEPSTFAASVDPGSPASDQNGPHGLLSAREGPAGRERCSLGFVRRIPPGASRRPLPPSDA